MRLLSRSGGVLLVIAVGLLVWGTGYSGRSFGPIRFLLRATPYGDKVGHFVLYGALAFAASLVVKNRISAFAAAFLLFILGIGDEYRQLFVGGRNFDLADILANTGGICAGLLTAFVVLRSVTGAPVETCGSAGEDHELEQARPEDDGEQERKNQHGSFLHLT